MYSLLFFVVIILSVFCMYNVVSILFAESSEEVEDYSVSFYVDNLKRLFRFYILGVEDEENESKSRDGP